MNLTPEQLTRVYELSGDVVYIDGHLHNLRTTLERCETERSASLAELRALLGGEAPKPSRCNPMDHNVHHYDDMEGNPLPIWRTDIDPLYWPILLRRPPTSYDHQAGFLDDKGPIPTVAPKSGGQKKLFKLLGRHLYVQNQFECLLLAVLKELDHPGNDKGFGDEYDALFDHISYRVGSSLKGSRSYILPIPQPMQSTWESLWDGKAKPTTEDIEAIILACYDYLSDFFIVVPTDNHNRHLPTVETILDTVPNLL